MNALDELYKRGIANSLSGIKKLSAEEIKNYEPHSTGIAGIFVPQTGIVDYSKVTYAYAKLFLNGGGYIETNCKFLSLINSDGELVAITTKGEFKTKFLVNCGGYIATESQNYVVLIPDCRSSLFEESTIN